MRKITQEAVNAFYNGEKFKRDNTEVYVNEAGENCFKLHRTVIARIQWNGKLWLNTDGWTSNTTKERLNGLLESKNMHIVQRKFKWYLGDNKTNTLIEFYDGMEVIL